MILRGYIWNPDTRSQVDNLPVVTSNLEKALLTSSLPNVFEQ
jgi:hypothetical protein